MTIRNASESDLKDIVEIYNQSIPGGLATADTQAVTIEQKTNWFHAHSEKRPIIVAEEKGVILGWVSLQNFYGRPAYSGTAEVSIYVRYGEQKKGIGEALLKHIIKITPEIDIHSLLGFIFSHNLPSISLFKKWGFEEWGHLPEVAIMNEKKISLLILGRKTEQNF